MKKIIALLLMIASMSTHAMEQNAYQNDGSEMQTYYVYGDESDSFMYDDPSYAAQMFDWQEMQNKRAIAQWASDRIFQLEDEYDNAMDVDDSLQAQEPSQEALKGEVNENLTVLKRMVNVQTYEHQAVEDVKAMRQKYSEKKDGKVQIPVIFTCHVCKFGNPISKAKKAKPSSSKDNLAIKEISQMHVHFRSKNHKNNLKYWMANTQGKDVLIEISRCIKKKEDFKDVKDEYGLVWHNNLYYFV